MNSSGIIPGLVGEPLAVSKENALTFFSWQSLLDSRLRGNDKVSAGMTN